MIVLLISGNTGGNSGGNCGNSGNSGNSGCGRRLAMPAEVVVIVVRSCSYCNQLISF